MNTTANTEAQIVPAYMARPAVHRISPHSKTVAASKRNGAGLPHSNSWARSTVRMGYWGLGSPLCAVIR